MVVPRGQLRRLLAWICFLGLAACSARSPDELLADARAAMTAGELPTAEIHLKNLLRQAPDNVAAYRLLAEVSLAEGEPAAAEQSLRKALELGANPAAVELTLLHALYDQGKYRELLAEVDAGPAPTGQDRSAVHGLEAEAYRELGALNAAESAYRTALELDPHALRLRIELASLLQRTGRREQAETLVKAVLAEQADFAPALMLEGSIELERAHYAAAETAFTAVLDALADQTTASDYTTALARLVECELALQELDAAAEHVDRLMGLDGHDATARYLKAKVEVEQGDLDSAERRLEGVIAEFPEYWPAYTVLGELNARAERTAQARMYLRQAVRGTPPEPRARPLLAALDLDEGDLAGAAALFGLAGEDTPGGPSGLFTEAAGVGDRVTRAEFEEAVAAIGAEPEDARQRVLNDYLTVLARLDDGDLEAAGTAATALTDALPEAPWLVNLEGVVALASGDAATARELFARALMLDPAYVPAGLNAARAAWAMADHGQAAAELRRVIAREPGQGTALCGLAELAIERRDFSAARKWLADAPSSAEQLRLEAEIAAGQGNAVEAATRIAAAYALRPSWELAWRSYELANLAGSANPEAEILSWNAAHPSDPRGNFALGSIALDRGETDTAIQRYGAVLDVAPDHPGALNNLAWLYEQRGDARALELARRAYDAEPNDPQLADTLGWIEVQHGAAERGLPLLEQAAAAAPDEPEIRYHWAVALTKTGDAATAHGVLETLLASKADFPSRKDAEALLAGGQE